MHVPTPPPVPPARVAAKPAAPKKPATATNPDTIRAVSLRQRLSELSGGMTLATFWGLALTGLVGLAASFWPVLGPTSVGLNDPGRATLFALGTILAAWAIQIPAKSREGSGQETSARRLIATSLGAAVGASLWWLSDVLWVEPIFESAFPGLFDRVFQFPLLSVNRTPTLVGFVVFFASLFALQAWWWQADSYRPRRFRLRTFLWSGAVAFFVPALFAFPQGWAVCWAMAISATVQLSSRWIAPAERPAAPADVA
jgi:hypothetical protein